MSSSFRRGENGFVLLNLLFILVSCSSLGLVKGNEKTSYFHTIYVPKGIIPFGLTTKVINTSSKAICIMEASRYDWCHLVCLMNDLCSLFDLLYPSTIGLGVPGDVEAGTHDACWTDVGPTDCIIDGTVLQDGHTHEVDCGVIVCRQGIAMPIHETGAKPCKPPFGYEEGIGCVLINNEKKVTFCEAELFCAEFGGRLLIPENYTALTRFKKFKEIYYWVGVREQNWLDGRDVLPAEWLPNYPFGLASHCGRLKTSANYFGLAEIQCAYKYNFICYLMT